MPPYLVVIVTKFHHHDPPKNVNGIAIYLIVDWQLDRWIDKKMDRMHDCIKIILVSANTKL